MTWFCEVCKTFAVRIARYTYRCECSRHADREAASHE
jgi:hypothetical protein